MEPDQNDAFGTSGTDLEPFGTSLGSNGSRGSSEFQGLGSVGLWVVVYEERVLI